MNVDDIDFEFQCDQGWDDFDGGGWCATCGKCDREVAFRDPQVERQRRGLDDLVATAAAIAAPLVGAAGGYAAAQSDSSPESRIEAVAGDSDFVEETFCDDDSTSSTPDPDQPAPSDNLADRAAEGAKAVSIARTAESLSGWLRRKNSEDTPDSPDERDRESTAGDTKRQDPTAGEDAPAEAESESNPTGVTSVGIDDPGRDGSSSDTPDLVDEREENHIAGGLKPAPID